MERRCPLVAREFRSAAQSTEETFAPTSSKYVVNYLLVLRLIHQLAILVCDIKGAFLTVPQRELVIVEVPEWIKNEEVHISENSVVAYQGKGEQHFLKTAITAQIKSYLVSC